MNKKQSKIILIVLIVILVAADIFAYYSCRRKNEAVFCTLDAKLCSDGSYVGRVAPDCEFASCPGEE